MLPRALLRSALSARPISRPLARRAPSFAGISAIGTRSMATSLPVAKSSRNSALVLAAAAAGVAGAAWAAPTTDWNQIRQEIADLLDDEDYDDGSYGPVLVRLGWHAAGTYCQFSNTGGSSGATMRFDPEASHGANAGLDVARNLLEQIKEKHPEISYADLWSLAACVAIEEMGGPTIPWKPGRKDDAGNANCTPDGRLPDAARGEDHVRAIFYRMGFSDQEIVALLGAHAMGRCHKDRSGFDGPWTNAPTTCSNDFFVQLLENRWRKRSWSGPEQYEDLSGQLMMLPADIALLHDPDFRQWVEIYAKDEDRWMKDFAAAFGKMQELGVAGMGGCPMGHGKKSEGKKKGWW